jgi:glycosyltransferase involved in cell wall biosynthesis
MVDYYNLCDAFVMQSKKEGFGIVFLEALASGKPVIAGNKEGSCDALLNGEVGILVDPDNVDEVAKAIINVLRGNVPDYLLDPQYLRETVLEHYGFDRFCQKVKELFHRI